MHKKKLRNLQADINVNVSSLPTVWSLQYALTLISCFNSFITIQQISASDSITEAEALAAKYRNTTPTLLDVMQSEETLNKLIQQHDVVIR